MKRPTNTSKSFLFQRTWEQYQKLLLRLQKSLAAGRFQELSRTRQRQFLGRLKKYLHRLKNLEFATKKVALGMALLANLMAATVTNAQTYVQPPCSNSLGFVDVGDNSYPVFGDLNGDNLQDAIIGNGRGEIFFFQNIGSATMPNFVAISGGANPFDGIDVGSNATPFLVDIDGDMDLDAFIGNNSGTIDFYRNDGTITNPIFNEQIGATNPFNGIDVGTVSAPNFVDIDGDGDLDAFIPSNNSTGGQITFFRNNGGTFTQITGANNPLDTAPVGANPLITFVDQDQDGDFDAFIGSQLGMIQYYRNVGDQNNPVYQLVSGTGNPFSGVDVGRNIALIPNPCFIDINGDGNMDVFIGSQDGVINYFENDPDIVCDNLNYEKLDGTDNPTDGFDVGETADPAFVDIDGDGDQDLFVGADDGTINFFINNGTSNSPNFAPISGNANPFEGVDLGDVSSIDFVDIDGDNILDAFVGDEDGNISFFSNTGTTTNPNFQQITGSGNPFNGFDAGDQSSPTFADIDQDGDLDAFIGNKAGQILFFRNDGNANTPNFVQFTDQTNPFFGVDLDGKFSPEFGDIDNDGDLDAIIGNKAGTLYYFRNDGTATSPKFVGLYGDCNPFDNILPILTTDDEFSSPALIDIDNDGNLEVFVGQEGGEICFLKRNIPLLVQKQDIPTMSQWGVMIFGLLMLNLGLLFLNQLNQLKATFQKKKR